LVGEYDHLRVLPGHGQQRRQVEASDGAGNSQQQRHQESLAHGMTHALGAAGAPRLGGQHGDDGDDANGDDEDLEENAGGQPDAGELHAAHPPDDHHVDDAHGDLGQVGGGEGGADAHGRGELPERLPFFATFHNRSSPSPTRVRPGAPLQLHSKAPRGRRRG
jgi:hypothetical protein